MVFVLVVVAVPYVIGAVGFTPAGVAALSIAAYVQSVFYGAVVGPGSLFAFLQSAGVVGLGWLSKLFLGSTWVAGNIFAKHGLSSALWGTGMNIRRQLKRWLRQSFL